MTRLLLASFLSVASINIVYAQDDPESIKIDGSVHCDPKDENLCSAPIKRNDSAPFSGQILTTKLAIKLAQKANFCDERIKIENEKTRKNLEIDLNLEKELHKIDNDINDKQIQILNKHLEQAVKIPFYRHPIFVASITFVATIGLTVLAIKGAQALQKN